MVHGREINDDDDDDDDDDEFATVTRVLPSHRRLTESQHPTIRMKHRSSPLRMVILSRDFNFLSVIARSVIVTKQSRFSHSERNEESPDELYFEYVGG